MRIQALAITGCLAAVMAIPALAKDKNVGDSAFRLLKDFRMYAYDASVAANRVETYTASDEIDWVGHADRLMTVRDDVNRMGKLLAKLEEARAAATPEEQAAIDRAAEILPKMATDTTTALNYLNAHQKGFWAAGYREPVKDLAVSATRLSSTTDEVVRLAQAQDKAKKLKHSLEAGA